MGARLLLGEDPFDERTATSSFTSFIEHTGPSSPAHLAQRGDRRSGSGQTVSRSEHGLRPLSGQEMFVGIEASVGICEPAVREGPHRHEERRLDAILMVSRRMKFVRSFILIVRTTL